MDPIHPTGNSGSHTRRFSSRVLAFAMNQKRCSAQLDGLAAISCPKSLAQHSVPSIQNMCHTTCPNDSSCGSRGVQRNATIQTKPNAKPQKPKTQTKPLRKIFHRYGVHTQGDTRRRMLHSERPRRNPKPPPSQPRHSSKSPLIS